MEEGSSSSDEDDEIEQVLKNIFNLNYSLVLYFFYKHV